MEQGNPPPGAKRIKNRKRKAPLDESLLTPEEAARRRRQRELRNIATTLRAKGENYNPYRFRRQEARRTGGGVVDGSKPRHASVVNLIIIPIFWNRKEEEKAAVLQAAGELQGVLRAAGVACAVDASHKLTPGQKYRHWEERGVMVRVEVGPSEAAKKRCLLAKCDQPGEVAVKQDLAVGPQLVAAALAALGHGPTRKVGQESGSEQPQEAEEEADAEPAVEKEGKKAKKEARGKGKGEAAVPSTKKVKVNAEEESAEAEDEAAPPASKAERSSSKKTSKSSVKASGDDLEGDFAGGQLLGDPGEGGKKGKKKKESEKVSEEGEEVKAEPLPKKKKAKVVKF